MLVFKPKYCIKRKYVSAVIQKTFTKEGVGAKRRLDDLINSNPKKKGKGLIYS